MENILIAVFFVLVNLILIGTFYICKEAYSIWSSYLVLSRVAKIKITKSMLFIGFMSLLVYLIVMFSFFYLLTKDMGMLIK